MKHPSQKGYKHMVAICNRADKMEKSFFDFSLKEKKEIINKAGKESQKMMQETIRKASPAKEEWYMKGVAEGAKSERERIIKKIKERKGYVEWATARDNQMHDLVIDGIVNDLQGKEKI